MLNRAKAPDIQDIKKLQLPKPDVCHLDNGIPVYATNMGTQEAIKLEIIFYAGRPYETKKLAARATASLLKEGTKNYNSAALAEQIDFYGGTISTPISLDTSNLILFSLNKHLDKLLPIVEEMLSVPTFPKAELAIFKERNQHRLLVDLTRTDVVAYRKITEFIFGVDHPYGYNSYRETYDDLQRADLVEHFQKTYTSGNCKIMLSGKITDKTLKLINQHLGQSIPKGTAAQQILPKVVSEPKCIKIQHPDSVQSAIRIGCQLFNRHHEDFRDLYVLNTVLGGYFGSRLMANIREEKGYTYNIYSSLDTMLWDGYFYIGTEVGNEFVKPTLKEIYKEFEILQTDLIDEEELQMVRNYLLGNLLTSLDGPFNVSEVIKTFITENVPFNEYDELVRVIKNISAKDIRKMAQKYLNREQMWEVIVGS